MAHTVTLQEAKSQFPELLARVIKNDEEIIISEAGTPVARLVPAAADPGPRVPGSAKGQIVIAPDFDDPLPPEVLDSFER